ARGHTLAGAGREMGVTDNGVNGLLRLVYRKLGARSAAHAVALAMARGLITPNDLAEPPHGRTAASTAPATTT
ncbi:hypothetical protein KBZ21_51260, partial [Streptomyces sp. A73]|nr:hypothetical protein [Streptomyces sp. A73]